MHTFTVGLCLLLIGLALFYGVRYVRARCPWLFENNWMQMVCVDEDGEQIGKSEWVRRPTPDRVGTNGLNHVVKYVARLVKSQSTQSFLLISSPDGEKACAIRREGDQLQVLEHVHLGSSVRVAKKPFRWGNFPPHPPQPEKEQAIRKLFAELEIAPDLDIVHDCNGYVDAMRELRYLIGNDIAQATLIIQRLLREVYHIQDTDALDFTFEG